MSRYYKGKHAHHYNTRWLRFNTRTLSETLAIIDVTALHNIKQRMGRAPRVLDVACGTGLLLKRLFAKVPDMEGYGLDASTDMLAEARAALQGYPDVHLEHLRIEKGMASNLPYPHDYFDLITCTNALHDIREAMTLLAELSKLLTPEGQLVVEDFAPRQPRLLWATFEWFLQLIEGNKVHAYTLQDAKLLCVQAGLRVDRVKVFSIDWLWHGWTMRAYRSVSEAMP
jgi:ubiquinone/menaquinone biosynthesis C-methylase UbiE